MTPAIFVTIVGTFSTMVGILSASPCASDNAKLIAPSTNFPALSRIDCDSPTAISSPDCISPGRLSRILAPKLCIALTAESVSAGRPVITPSTTNDNAPDAAFPIAGRLAEIPEATAPNTCAPVSKNCGSASIIIPTPLSTSAGSSCMAAEKLSVISDASSVSRCACNSS